MISPRYIPALCVIFAVALVPTVIHSYVGLLNTDDLTTSSIAPSLSGLTSVPSGRTAEWAQRRFEGFDWMERRYGAGRNEVLLTVIRSYDLKRLYHHPEIDVAYGAGFVRHETRRFVQDPAVPVHVLYSNVEGGPVALYALHYGSGFVDDPLMFQIRTAGELLFRGRQPMTLLFARSASNANDADPETLPATRLLFEAIDQFTQTGRR